MKPGLHTFMHAYNIITRHLSFNHNICQAVDMVYKVRNMYM